MSEENQLPINFERNHALREAIRDGRFCTIIEYCPPRTGSNQLDYLPTLQKLAAEASQHPEITCFALADQLHEEDQDSLNFCREILSHHGAPPIMHVSGTGRALNEIRERINEGMSKGITAILALSGNFRKGSELYCESPDILRAGRKADEQLFLGAGVNPFKYSVNSCYSQYLKMVQKVHCGAEFIVTQAGIDMRKYDEVLRYCTMRELSVPLIAQLSLIGDDLIKQLREGRFSPGVHCSREFANRIEREAKESSDFHSRQMDRLALQIIGCRFMGYNGVQLKGIRTAVQLHQLHNALAKHSKAVRSFEEWHKAWDTFHKGISLCSPPSDFYIFRNWKSHRPVDRENEGVFELERKSQFIFPAQSELRKIKILRALKADRDSKCGVLLRKISGLQNAPGDLRHLQFLDMNSCAKKLLHGVCGGSDIQGMCENGKDRCIHLKRTALAAYFNELDTLENSDN